MDWTALLTSVLGSGGTLATGLGGWWVWRKGRTETAATALATAEEQQDKRIADWVTFITDALAVSQVKVGKLESDLAQMWSHVVTYRNRDYLWFQSYNIVCALLIEKGGVPPALHEALLTWPDLRLSEAAPPAQTTS